MEVPPPPPRISPRSDRLIGRNYYFTLYAILQWISVKYIEKWQPEKRIIIIITIIVIIITNFIKLIFKRGKWNADLYFAFFTN